MHCNSFYHDQEMYDSEFSKEIKERLYKLNLYHDLLSEGCSQEVAFRAVGASRATIYRWKGSYRSFGVHGLESNSRKPKNTRKPTWTAEQIMLVLKIRKENLTWGKDKIKAVIRRDFGLETSTSMVGRILSFLVKKGDIKPARFYYGHIRPRKKRCFNGHAQRWEYGMRPTIPGELIQVDHATRKLSGETIIKSFKAVDQVTKWSAEQAYTAATALVARDFLEHMRLKFPFKIKSIMVDGGSEFMAEFEEACRKENILLYVLPPRSPKYNGCVEKGNSTTKYEFYTLYEGQTDLSHLRTRLQAFIHRYNTYRPHQALQYLTPLEYCKRLEAF